MATAQDAGGAKAWGMRLEGLLGADGKETQGSGQGD